MSYIDDKIKEIDNLLKSDESIKTASGNPKIGLNDHEIEMLNIAEDLIKAAHSPDITIEDLRNFLHKKGDLNMDKELLLKAANIIRATAEYIKNDRLQKEAAAKEAVSKKLKDLGVKVDDKKIEKIVKDKDVVDVLNNLNYEAAPRIGEGADAENLKESADERFLRALGL